MKVTITNIPDEQNKKLCAEFQRELHDINLRQMKKGLPPLVIPPSDDASVPKITVIYDGPGRNDCIGQELTIEYSFADSLNDIVSFNDNNRDSLLEDLVSTCFTLLAIRDAGLTSAILRPCNGGYVALTADTKDTAPEIYQDFAGGNLDEIFSDYLDGQIEEETT